MLAAFTTLSGGDHILLTPGRESDPLVDRGGRKCRSSLLCCTEYVMSGQCWEELAAPYRVSVGHSKAEMLACSVGEGPRTCGVVHTTLNKGKFPLLPDPYGEGRGHLTDRHCYLFIRKDAEDSGMSLLLSDLTIDCVWPVTV